MVRTIEISDEQENRFDELIESGGAQMDIDERINYLMSLGKMWLENDPYQPIDRHEDCVMALEIALRARYGIDHDQFDRYDLLFSCAAVALSSPDDVADELCDIIHC